MQTREKSDERSHLGKITEGKDLLGKIRNFLSGFVGYVDRENRREADKLLREHDRQPVRGAVEPARPRSSDS